MATIKNFDTYYGEVSVRTCIFPDMSEGFEIKLEDGEIIEIFTSVDIDELTAKEVEKYIDDNL